MIWKLLLCLAGDKKPKHGATNTANIKLRKRSPLVEEMQLPPMTLQTRIESGRNKAEVILTEASKG